ncbi:hypothetical protein ACFVZR_07560 [Streptomyces sp. NPDC058316]|uniref:hypothetical protein n=1 Tax=Streptomyces sp. NPDC058316 TaxID=3346442 RepID=UPI0036EAEBEC
MTTPADELRAAVRAIHALKFPPPDGSQHYQAGWDAGLEAAIEAVQDAFEQAPALAVGRQVLGTETAEVEITPNPGVLEQALSHARQILGTTEQAAPDEDSHEQKVAEYLSTPYTDDTPSPTAVRVGRCPVMFEGGGRCEKNADHRAGRWPDDPHTPEPTPAVTEEPGR